MSIVFKNLLIALAYAGLGWASLHVAIAPDYVSFLFLPSGLALAVVLTQGLRVVPGVWLGSLMVQWLATQQSGVTAAHWAMLSAPAGAMLQAVAGAALARRWVGYPTALDTPSSVMTLLLGVVPLSCLINASLTVPLLVFNGIIPPEEATYSWWTWWLGDALGGVILMPLLLVFMGEPAALWRPRRLALSLPMGIAALFVAFGFIQVNEREDQATEQYFARQSSELASQVQRRFDAQADSVLAVAHLFALSDRMSASAFEASVRLWLQRYPGTQNFGWSPLVKHAERNAFEARQRARGVGHFEIRGRNPEGQTFRAPQRAEYLPLTLIEPLATNRDALGLDVMVLPATATAVAGARDTGRPHVSEGLRLVQEPGGQRGVVMYQAVFHDDRRTRLKGVVSAVFRMDDVLALSTGPLERWHIQLCLTDPDAAAGNQRLSGPPGCEAPEWLGRKLHTQLPIEFGNQRWVLRLRAEPSFTASAPNWLVWGGLALGLASVGLLGAFLLVVTGHTRRTQALVDQRTAELARSNAGLEQLAHFDVLTGLPNRSSWMNQARAALLAAQRHHDIVAVVFLDLDHFKNVNDTLGHAVGDQLLQAVAQRLTTCLRAEDVLARIGGDEFVALLPRLRRLEDAVPVAQKFLSVLSEPLVLEGNDITLTVSVGVAASPPDAPDIDLLLRHADTAMYAAKDAGRNGLRVFSPEMTERVSRRLFIENGLRRALERGELFLEYQPQIDAKSGRPVGAEALLRWQHPEQGRIPPQDFIPVAEDSGLIEPIGRWVLHEACRQAQACAAQGHPLQIAVNISPLQFQRADFVETVRDALAASGASPHQLELEITESLLMRPLQDLNDKLNELTQMGITLSLDDFGTGYSSLGYLKRLPLARLKIDRSFVADVPGDQEDEAITKATLSMARDLGLEVVAEGVEVEAQRDYLLDHHCDVLQGWLYARAMPADQLLHWLDDRAERRLTPLNPNA